MGMFCLELKPRLAYANFAHQTDAMDHKHGLAQVLTFLVFVKWGKRMRKASVHGYYRYVKEMAAARLTH
jgi:hypothetical protein